MNTEWVVGLERRASVHAALADPARLRIVDRLSDGDASPTDLQTLLGMSSNLLAHHLGVLGRVGLLVRHRSEADRRRTYLHLVPDALDALSPTSRVRASRVLFVCTANTARSQLAASLWSRVSSVPTASAGTHPGEAIAPGAVAAAARHHLSLRRRRPRAIDDVLAEDDYVVTVCDHAHEELQRSRRLSCVAHWSVRDPVPVGTDTAFDAAVDDLAERVAHLAPRVTES